MSDNNPYLNRFLLSVLAAVGVLVIKDHIPARYADELGAIGLGAIVAVVAFGIRALVLAGLARSRQGGEQ